MPEPEHGPAPDEPESFSHPLLLQGIKFQPGSTVARQSEGRAGVLGCWGRGLLPTCSQLLPCRPNTLFSVCSEFAELYCWKLGHGDQSDPVQ